MQRRTLAGAMALWALADVRAQDGDPAAELERAADDLRSPLDVERRERGLRCLVRIAGGRAALSSASASENDEVRRLATRGLAFLEPERAPSLWCGAAESAARRTRREAALRLAHDLDAGGESALRALLGDPFDDVQAAALAALRARGAVDLPVEVPHPAAYDLLRRLWVARLPWTDSGGVRLVAERGDAPLREALYRRIAREGLPPGCDAELLRRAFGSQARGGFDRAKALAFLAGASGSAAEGSDLFDAVFESELGADALSELDRAVLLRCIGAGARLPRALERLRHVPRDRVAWLFPVWPWLLDPLERATVLRTNLNFPLGEELAPLLASDPALASWSSAGMLELYKRARSAAVRAQVLRAAARIPERFSSALEVAASDEEPLLREQSAQAAIELERFDQAIAAAERESSPVVQVRLGSALADALESRGEAQRVRALALRWAQSAEPGPKRVALHLLLASEPDDLALEAARELWARTAREDGERSDVYALLARFPAAREEIIEGLRELGAEEARRARERVGSLEAETVRNVLGEESALALPVRGELAWRRALLGDATAAAFLRERFSDLPEELAFRALDAMAATPAEEAWSFFERLRLEERIDADVLLESAAPMLELAPVERALREALAGGDPQLRQAALRGLGRAGARGQAWLRSAPSERFSGGDLTAWVEALDRSEPSTAKLAEVISSRLARGPVLAGDRLRPEIARAFLRLQERGPFADAALSERLSSLAGQGGLDSLPSSVAGAVVEALGEKLPRSAAVLAHWVFPTAEPEAELTYRTALALARRSGDDAERARACLASWLAAREELEARGQLAARESGALEIAGPPQAGTQGLALLALFDVRSALARGDAEAARAHYDRALAAAFFDANARAFAHAYGARHTALAERAQRDAARWSSLGLVPAAPELHALLRDFETFFSSH